MRCGAGRPVVDDFELLAVVQELAACHSRRRQGLRRRGPFHPKRCEELTSGSSVNSLCDVLYNLPVVLVAVVAVDSRDTAQRWRDLGTGRAERDA